MRFVASRRWLALLVCLAAGGCKRGAPTSDRKHGAPAPAARPALAGPGKPAAERSAGGAAGGDASVPGPRSRTELRTTSSKLAMRNFQGTIRQLEKREAQQPLDRTSTPKLIEHLLARAQLLGQLADYDRALALAEALVKKHPKQAQGYVTRASVRAALHRFSEALADLATAEKLGARPLGQLTAVRLSALQGTGRFDEAQKEREKLAEARPSIGNLLPLASLLAERGQIERAERIFRKAEREYRGVSPFPLVQLYYREGLMWERAGQLERARRFYAGGHERLSVHAGVTSRLAAAEARLGQRPRAIELLRGLVQKSDDPDYQAQLAELLRDEGKTDEADALVAKARTRFEELVARHPAAFADHAARFWLGPGKDPARALVQARTNLETRKTPEAYQLVIRAALAAKQPQAACAAADAALKTPGQPRWLLDAAARAHAACGRGAGAPAARPGEQTSSP